MAENWRAFWDGEHSVYVSARHKAIHYRAIADGILELAGEAGLKRDAVLLDYACGEALEAERVAARVGRLVLCDGAPSVVAGLKARFAAVPAIRACLPEELDRLLAPGRVDLVVVSSLIQYLTRPEFEALLDRFHALLAPGATLVIADVIPPDAGMVADIASLLRNGLRHGFFFASIAGLAATAVSPYRTIRGKLGLTSYAIADMLALFSAHGFAATVRPVNLGLTPHRITFTARRTG